MIKFSGVKLVKDDMDMLRMASKYTLDKYINKSRQKKINIDVILIDDKKITWGGECYYMGIDYDLKNFEIRINHSLLKKHAKKPETRMKDLVVTTIHELIHVKQYTNNQLFDYVDGSVRYEGKIYKDTDSWAKYWDNPWEIDAYGRTVGTYELFIRHYKQTIKEAKKVSHE